MNSYFTINNKDFNEKWDEKVYHSMVEAIQTLPQPTFHANKLIPLAKRILFVDQRSGVYTTGEKPTADFFATHGVSQCMLIYMYSREGDRLFIHLDNKPCDIEPVLTEFKDRKVDVVLAGGSLTQDVDFEAILKPFLQGLYQLSQTKKFSFHIVKQMILKENKFDEREDMDVYAIDFILRKANFISKQVFHELLPASVVQQCFDIMEKKGTVRTDPLDLITFLPLLQNAHPIQINLENIKSNLEFHRHPLVETKNRFHAKLKTIFDHDILQMFKKVIIGNAGINAFSFPPSRMRHVGVELQTGQWYTCTEVMDQRPNRYIRALHHIDFSWPQMPHMLDTTGDSLDQVILHPSLSILSKKIVDTLKLHFKDNLDGLYHPGMIDMMKRAFRLDQMGLSLAATTHALEEFINFIQIKYVNDPQCLSPVALIDMSVITKDPSPNYLLRDMASKGNLDQMKQVMKLRGVNVNAKGPKSGKTALHFAAEKGHISCVEYLLGLEADSSILDDGDKTPLHLAIANGNVEIVYMLMAKKPSKNPKIPYGILKRKDSDDLDVDKFL